MLCDVGNSSVVLTDDLETDEPRIHQIGSVSLPCHLIQKVKNKQFPCVDFTLQKTEGKAVWENAWVVLGPWRRPNGRASPEAGAGNVMNEPAKEPCLLPSTCFSTFFLIYCRIIAKA